MLALLRAIVVFCLISGAQSACPCSGVVVQSNDQPHCWEVLPRPASTWIDADVTCESVGGHLGHPNGTESKEIFSYVQKNYTKPVLTGVVAGSAQAGIYALLCPGNSIYGLLPNDTTFVKNATDTNTCSFIIKDSDLLAFGPCTQEANILCDRPMEKEDYCNVMMTCTSTSTTAESATTSTTTRTKAANTTSTAATTTKTTTKSSVVVVPTDGKESATTTTSKPSSTTTRAPTKYSCAGCGPHQWSIFGWCTDWRILLIILLIFLALFLLCCLLHCCCKLCISPCQVKKEQRKKAEPRKAKDPPLPITRTVPERRRDSQNLNPYVLEKPEAILPPPATVTQPVFVPIPVKETKQEPEIRFVVPEKPEMVDVGVNTDSFWPVRKRKKVDQIQIRQAPKTRSPLAEVDTDLAEEVSLHMERPRSADTVLPKGDIPDPEAVLFMRNAEPRRIESQPIPTVQLPRKKRPTSVPSEPPPPKASTIPDQPFRNRQIRSPPTSARANPVNETTFQPPQSAPEPRSARSIPSPPRTPEPNLAPNHDEPVLRSQRQPKSVRANNNDGGLTGDRIPSPPIMSSAPKQSKEPTFMAPPAPPTRKSPNPSPSSPNLPRGSVSMRKARGKLGGVVHAGGRGGAPPSEWKAWSSNNSSSLSQPQQFLSSD